MDDAIRGGGDTPKAGGPPEPTRFEREQAERIVRQWVGQGLACMPASEDDQQMMRSDIANTLATNRAIRGEGAGAAERGGPNASDLDAMAAHLFGAYSGEGRNKYDELPIPKRTRWRNVALVAGDLLAGQTGDRPPVGWPNKLIAEMETWTDEDWQCVGDWLHFDRRDLLERLRAVVGLTGTLADRPAPSPGAVDLARHMLDNRAMWEHSPTTRVKSSELLAIAEALAAVAPPTESPRTSGVPESFGHSAHFGGSADAPSGTPGAPGAPDPLDAMLDEHDFKVREHQMEHASDYRAAIQPEIDAVRAAIHAHVADLTAERDEIAGLHRAVARLANERADEVLDLRATNAKLNRRAQEAESRVAKLERQIKTSPVTNLRKNMPLVKEIADLRARAESAERDRDKYRGQVVEMVNLAADQKLDGYRELGARAAAAEERADALRAERDGLAAEVRASRECYFPTAPFQLTPRWEAWQAAQRANEERGWPSTPEERP